MRGGEYFLCGAVVWNWFSVAQSADDAAQRGAGEVHSG